MKSIEILMVEDDPGDGFLIREALNHSGLSFRLHHVDNGETALDFLLRRKAFETAIRPDLILLDLNLPRIGGIEILGELSALPDFSMPPVLVLTTSRNEADVAACKSLGASGFLSKPPTFDEFLNIGNAIAGFWREYAGERQGEHHG